MAIITFQCSKCQKVMRIGADKAGKRAKCSKCGQSLVIPAESQPPKTAQQQARLAIFGDEEDGLYQFKDDPAAEETNSAKFNQADLYKSDEEKDDDEEDEDDEKEAKEREQRRLFAERRKTAMARMRKAPIDFSIWDKVRLGILLVMVGVGFWMAAVFLQKLVFLFGLPSSAEYAEVAANDLINKAEPPEIGVVPTLYRAHFIIGLIGGRDMIDLNLWLYRVSYLCILIQLVCTATGYFLCLSAPSRFGSKGLATALLPIVAFSFIVTLTLKLLPISGAYNYTMIPLIAPETAILRSNIEREIPIHMFWSVAPFSESLLAILLHLATFGELALFCIFLRTIAQNLKDEKLQEATEPLVQLGLSIGFILLAFHLLINTGTTEVLINILWVVYLFAFSFYIWFLIWYMMVLNFARARILKNIRIFGGDEVSEEDEEDDDEDEDEVEEDDDEDEDED